MKDSPSIKHVFEAILFFILLIGLVSIVVISRPRLSQSGATVATIIATSPIGEEPITDVTSTPSPTLQPTGTPLGTPQPTLYSDPAYPAPGQFEPTPIQYYPVPTTAAYPGPLLAPTLQTPPAGTLPTSQASDPYVLFAGGPLDRDISHLSQSPLIVVGSVQQVIAARWTTPDGKRPTNPHAQDNPYTIFTPVTINIERVIKGKGVNTPITIIAYGGQVGKDRVTYTDGIDAFDKGEHVLLFLDKSPTGFVLGTTPLWSLSEHYTFLPDGQTSNKQRTISQQQLLREINAALGLSN